MQPSTMQFLSDHRVSLATNLLLLSVLCLGCGEPAALTVDMPLHLEEHLDDATIEGSEVPADLPEPVEWRFDEPQPDWRPAKPVVTQWDAVEPVRVDDALRLSLTARHLADGPRWIGAIYVDLPDWNFGDWAYVEIRARTRDPMNRVGLYFNYNEEDRVPWASFPFYAVGDRSYLVTDGTVQTYRLSLDDSSMREGEGSWTHLGIWFNSQADEEAVTLDILSVRVIPRAHVYADTAVGVQEIAVGNHYQRALFTHAPGRLEYQVRVPEGGRIDVGLGVLGDDIPVTFRVQVRPQGGEPATVLEERYDDQESWGQRSVDLAEFAGQTVRLIFEADAEEPGAVAFWGAPTVSGSARMADKPNVIFYVIDGAGAEYMSVYGYNRRTTPNIERLAAEGALFERAYSNSSWTRPSTASFMTSLQHSVLGGFKGGFNVVPEDAPTMAQHLHRAGYQTGVFTANPNAGRMSGLEREVDSFREGWTEFGYGDSNWKQSSSYLHEAFWTWRETYPAEPYWAHFQTVDIHSDFPAVAPFGGLFVSSEETKTWEEIYEQVWKKPGNEYVGFFEDAGVDRVGFFSVMQGLYDESMAHNDYQLGRLVERLKAEGEWENTLLIVAADHSIDAAMVDVGVLIQDSVPPAWNRPMFRPSISRVPLLFVWPGHIAGGQRFSEPVVSMIDVLPTILDLVDLPLPEVMQGQSLAPLLLGEGGVEPRPVILDEFEVDRATGELRGQIEVIDGRWGASLEINPDPEVPEEERRPSPLLLYDLWNDPYCLNSVHEEHPDLVEKYTAFLLAQFEAHQALGQLFTPSESVALTPEQLEMLRALGYIN